MISLDSGMIATQVTFFGVGKNVDFRPGINQVCHVCIPGLMLFPQDLWLPFQNRGHNTTILPWDRCRILAV